MLGGPLGDTFFSVMKNAVFCWVGAATRLKKTNELNTTLKLHLATQQRDTDDGEIKRKPSFHLSSLHFIPPLMLSHLI